ncbi:hypothetical protein MANES_05G014704v8 [Manihot esculenta]|uniref:Uncharacterized protein n=1 Tax=Manihot esculenta TaxID=3983 RepID=A0ACB7HKQ3_MANES|nr:hypothetical protein MANES_05G014704v8 [Manihot esculenta]
MMFIFFSFCSWKFIRFRVLLLFLLYRTLFSAGLALLKFRERIVSDPYDALKNWKDEDGVVNPCYWFGVECSDGKVVELNLKDLYLGGTLAPDLRNLVRIKSIILHNNSFTGIIPEGIGELKELEVLDFGNNNFSGPLPPVLDSSLSLTILLLDNNRLLSNLSPEIHRLETHSEFQVDENQLASAAKGPSYNERQNAVQTENAINKRQLQVANAPRVNESPYLRSRFSVPEAPSESGKAPPRSVAPPFSLLPSPPVNNSIQSPPPEPNPAPSSPPAVVSLPTPLEPNPPSASPNGSASNPLLKTFLIKKHVSIIAGAIGGALLAMSIVIFYVYKINKATVKPWATGLSGQLQKAFVTGCEDFSSVIGSSPIGTLYKGTLSSGIEIAVASVAVTSSKDWPKHLEVQFRKKIETLSKVNHKNFINLFGYCEEDILLHFSSLQFLPVKLLSFMNGK